MCTTLGYGGRQGVSTNAMILSATCHRARIRPRESSEVYYTPVTPAPEHPLGRDDHQRFVKCNPRLQSGYNPVPFGVNRLEYVGRLVFGAPLGVGGFCTHVLSKNDLQWVGTGTYTTLV